MNKRMMVIGRGETLEVLPVWYPADLDQPVRAVLPPLRVHGIRMQAEDGSEFLKFPLENIRQKVEAQVQWQRGGIPEGSHIDWITVNPGMPLAKLFSALNRMSGREFEEMMEQSRARGEFE